MNLGTSVVLTAGLFLTFGFGPAAVTQCFSLLWCSVGIFLPMFKRRSLNSSGLYDFL